MEVDEILLQVYQLGKKIGHNWGEIEYEQDIEDIRELLSIFSGVIMVM
jgi:hypothetical protein